MADGVPHGQAEALHDVEHLVALLKRDQLPRIRHLHGSRAPSAHMCMIHTESLHSRLPFPASQAVSITGLGKMHVGKKYMIRSQSRSE